MNAGTVAVPLADVMTVPSETVFPLITIDATSFSFLGSDFTTGATTCPTTVVTVGAFAEVVAGFEIVGFFAVAAL